MQRLHVFVDESGDEHLHIDRGASPKYVLSAICVLEEHLADFMSAANDIRRFYFQSAEIKSSKIGANHARRKVVLARIDALPFWCLAFVVRKESVHLESGLRFAPSFLKFTAQRLCAHLPLVDEVHVQFDEKGRSPFRESFERYLKNSFENPDLFRVMTFGHANSRGALGIQIADLMAGSIAKWHSNRHVYAGLGIDALLRKKASVVEWPTLRSEGRLPESEGDRFDEIVRRESFARIQNYLDRNVSDPDEDIRLRCVFLEWLMSTELLGGREFVLADQLVHKANTELGLSIDGQMFRNKVVGPLRDEGLLIASSARGYKVPGCLEDLMKYVDLCASQIPPAVHRLKKARDVFLIATGGQLDLLSTEANLRSIVESAES